MAASEKSKELDTYLLAKPKPLHCVEYFGKTSLTGTNTRCEKCSGKFPKFYSLRRSVKSSKKKKKKKHGLKICEKTLWYHPYFTFKSDNSNLTLQSGE